MCHMRAVGKYSKKNVLHLVRAAHVLVICIGLHPCLIIVRTARSCECECEVTTTIKMRNVHRQHIHMYKCDGLAWCSSGCCQYIPHVSSLNECTTLHAHTTSAYTSATSQTSCTIICHAGAQYMGASHCRIAWHR